MTPFAKPFAAAPLASLLLFSGVSLAQIFAPDCSLTWAWTFNTLDQNACTVAAYLMSTCNGGAFTVSALQPGASYVGPSGIDDSDLCKCNTVTYSLISACDACQGETWISWSEFVYNCTTVLPPSSFPNPIPLGTRVPQWALLDVTTGNNWNSNQSLTTGDSPEILPGKLLGTSGATTSAAAATATGGSAGTHTAGTHTTSSYAAGSTAGVPAPTSKSSSNVGAIVGGAVGGVAAISIALAAIFFFMRRQRPQAPVAATPGVGAFQPPMEEVQQPLADDSTYAGSTTPGTPVAAMKLYDPSDPTTYPGYQGQAVPQSPDTPQGFTPLLNGTTNSLATMQTSRPQDQGYHGLPIV